MHTTRHSSDCSENIISFNTQTYCKALQDVGISTTAPQQIFTFMQMMGEEKIEIMLPRLNEHYRSNLEAMMSKDVALFDAGVICYAYEVHDMKMNHILYGKESWNYNEGGWLPVL
mgnify:CR=1 FL=1